MNGFGLGLGLGFVNCGIHCDTEFLLTVLPSIENFLATPSAEQTMSLS